MAVVRKKYDPEFVYSLQNFCRDSPFEYIITVHSKKTKMACAPFTPSENGYKINKNVTDNEKVLRKFKCILNKITFKNFNKLSEELYNIEITNNDLAANVMKLVFDKVLFEPSFGELYSILCNALSNKYYCNNINFKRELLTLCQKEFYNDNFDPDSYKRKVNNILFLGELYKKGVIHEIIIMQCLTAYFKVISQIEKSEEAKIELSRPEQNKIECTCKLLVSTGPKICVKFNKEVQGYVLTLENISLKISPRFRFMICDVIDLQKKAWIIRRKKNR